MKRRIIYNDNGQHIDLTGSLNDYHSGSYSFNIVASQDTIFIGSILPFNSFNVEFGNTKNAIDSTLQIRLWDGNSWEDVAEVIDSTKSNSATFALNGHVKFIPNKNKTWNKDDTVYSNGNEFISGLGTTIIYDQYWCAVSFSNSLTSSLDVNWIGAVYSDDTAMKVLFPDLVRTEVMSIVSDSTNFNSQHVMSAKIIEKDLIAKDLIVSKDQLLDKDDLELASIYKTAELVFNSLGDDYKDDATKSEKKYWSRLNNAFPKVDRNANATLDDQEKKPAQSRLYR